MGLGAPFPAAWRFKSSLARSGQETLHLVESMASFSLRFGCGSGTGCGELGRLFFGVGGHERFHRKRDPLRLCVGAEHFDLHNLSGLDRFGGILNSLW